MKDAITCCKSYHVPIILFTTWPFKLFLKIHLTNSHIYVKILKGGTKIYHLNEDTVLYRSDGDSVTREKYRHHFFKQTFFDNQLMFRKDIIFPLYKWYDISFWISEYSFRILYFFTIKVLRNRRTKINNVIYLSFKALNPYYLIRYIGVQLNK